MKATAIAPSNIAFIKYWGLKNSELRIPTNGSVSMNLSNLYTTTTVEFNSQLKGDDIVINGEKDEKQIDRVSKHLDRIRKIAQINTFARVVSKNTFPTASGLSSSASGFAALSKAAINAAGIFLTEEKLSILARLGSGSACRSIPSGFVEWVGGDDNDNSYAKTIFPPDWWDIYDIVVVVSTETKKISTSFAQLCAFTSPFFKIRLLNIDNKIQQIKTLIKEKNFIKFGELVESEALELHAIMFTSKPPLLYIFPETLKLIKLIHDLRSLGMPVYFTLNTGHDIHIVTLKKYVDELGDKLKKYRFIKKIYINKPSSGTKLTDNHLF